MQNRDPDENGWKTSAPAWIEAMATDGDFSRQFVLDQPMLARVKAAAPVTALDIGCGEGRFCRKLRGLGVMPTGLDPIDTMVRTAQEKDPDGDYVVGFAEKLPFKDAQFDLVVTYLSLIDIDDAKGAITEMARVLKPDGRILVANLSSFSTSSAVIGRRTCKDTGEELRPLGQYLETGQAWFEWGGMRIQNWHRPLSAYMQWFLGQHLVLTHFDEPSPTGGPSDRVQAYQKMPYLMMMEWQKKDP